MHDYRQYYKQGNYKEIHNQLKLSVKDYLIQGDYKENLYNLSFAIDTELSHIESRKNYKNLVIPVLLAFFATDFVFSNVFALVSNSKWYENLDFIYKVIGLLLFVAIFMLIFSQMARVVLQNSEDDEIDIQFLTYFKHYVKYLEDEYQEHQKLRLKIEKVKN